MAENWSLLLIGSIMTASGILVFVLGRIRKVPNSFLWAIFPFGHGLHEFFDYIAETIQDSTFIIERFEIFFSLASALALLAAAMEYNGALPRPIGKISSLIGLTFLTYLTFLLPEDIIEGIEEFVILGSDPIRFLHGFVIVLMAAGAILFSYLYLRNQAKKGLITIERNLTLTSIVSAILLVIFSVFEGFNYQSDILISLRAISLAIFLIVPIFVVLVSKFGLQNLLILNENGMILYGYNFSDRVVLSLDQDKESTDALLKAGFLAAISTFSRDVLHAGTSFTIRANRLNFIMKKEGNNIFTLQTINYDGNLEKKFSEFTRTAMPLLEKVSDLQLIDNPEFSTLVNDSFKQYN
ncbi:MAG: hypothetical protein ACFFDW_15460 [Candidatus Thorarchaeota archaeon]